MKNIFLGILWFGVLTIAVFFFCDPLKEIWAANAKSVTLTATSAQSGIASDTAAVSITGDITVEAWLKLTDNGANQYILEKDYETDPTLAAYRWNIDSADTMSFVYRGTGGETRFYIDYSSYYGSWHHFMVVVDVSAASSTWYVDCGFVADTTFESGGTDIPDTTKDFGIGQRVPYNTYNGNGLFDEIRLWDDMRTTTECVDNYQKELDGTEANLQAYYKMEDDMTDSDDGGATDLTEINSPSYTTDIPSWPGAGIEKMPEQELLMFGNF